MGVFEFDKFANGTKQLMDACVAVRFVHRNGVTFAHRRPRMALFRSSVVVIQRQLL
jgi:hypothetical protein